MINSKAIYILKGMTKKELLKFEKFLSSSFFNNSKKIVQLFRLLKKHYPAFNSPNLNRENIFRQIYGRVKYNDALFRKLLSELYKLGEKFLVMVNLESNKLDFNKLLLEELDARRIDRIYASKFNEASELLDKIGMHYQIFFRKHELKWQNVHFHLARGNQDKMPGEIFERTEQLIFYFFSDLFLSLNDIRMNKLNLNYSHSHDLPRQVIDNINIEEIFDYISRHDIKNKDIFALYYYSFLLIKHYNDSEYYYVMKKQLLQNIDKLNDPGKMNFILFMTNYCNLKTKEKRDSEFENEKIELYELIVRHKLYKTDKTEFIRPDFFLNIFMSYVRHRNLFEADKFLQKHIGKIDPVHGKNITSLCSALILFEEGKFSESLQTTSDIISNLIIIKIFLRVLLLKIDYELNEFDENKDALGNFRHFITNSKSISEINKDNMLQFIKNYGDLLKFKNKQLDEFSLKQLKENSEKIKDATDRDWFVRKISQLERTI